KLKVSKRNFKAALLKNGLALIAEFKRKSPSKNIKEKDFDMREIIGIYDKYASAISVLTDKKFFNGSPMDLEEASKLTNLPLLRKDFIVDEYQIYESRMCNADAVLLIVSILTHEEIKKFMKIAKRYNMDCIVEVHTEEELSRALSCNAEIIGINNRDLDTLKIDIGTTLRLAEKIPKNKIIISESGISSRDYVEKIRNKVNAILVGSHFMNSKNVEKGIIALIK
ncbi:MAG: indole-3-glycerol phosphate synthase TrpC, partial [Nanoarchaeota archaeon]